MSHRPEKIASEIHHRMSEILRDELPIEIFGIVTITEVTVTPGLEHCKIYFSAFKSPEDIEKTLNRKMPFFKHLLEQQIKMRKFPELVFVTDDSGDRLQRIEQLLSEDP